MGLLPLGALVSNSGQSLRLHLCLALTCESTREAGERGDFPESSQSELEVPYGEETKRFKSTYWVVQNPQNMQSLASQEVTVFSQVLVCLPRYLEGQGELEQLRSFRNISGFHVTWGGWLFRDVVLSFPLDGPWIKINFRVMFVLVRKPVCSIFSNNPLTQRYTKFQD